MTSYLQMLIKAGSRTAMTSISKAVRSHPHEPVSGDSCRAASRAVSGFDLGGKIILGVQGTPPGAVRKLLALVLYASSDMLRRAFSGFSRPHSESPQTEK
mmetsp:Transcript_74082/g.179226  ORF Transcript_74082/g.179226 Transcript_74082/m.179226 type:complete len:100 (+) Transcript_74082:220-519(+)